MLLLSIFCMQIIVLMLLGDTIELKKKKSCLSNFSLGKPHNEKSPKWDCTTFPTGNAFYSSLNLSKIFYTKITLYFIPLCTLFWTLCTWLYFPFWEQNQLCKTVGIAQQWSACLAFVRLWAWWSSELVRRSLHPWVKMCYI